jgi:hypothetical protein
MKFEHKVVVVVCSYANWHKREAVVQEVLDKHRDWRLVSTASFGTAELDTANLFLCFTRDV